MPDALLTTLSQVGVAIAGFSGIALALIAVDDIAWLRMMTSTIKAVLETSLTVTVFALLPLALEFLLEEPFAGLASLTMLFALWHLWILILAIRRGDLVWSNLSFVLILVGAVLVIFAQTVVAVANLEDYLWPAFLAGLFWLLIISAFNFCLLLYARLDHVAQSNDSVQ